MDLIKFKLLLFFSVICFWGCEGHSKNSIDPPKGLLCELMNSPEKALITDQSPEFGWILDNKIKEQTSYRILVASSIDLLSEQDADVWDSEKVNSKQSINVDYNGNALAENSSYWWKVKIWDAAGNESDYSQAQQFYTSLFNRDDNKWPGESHFVQLPNGTWVSENRQTAEFERINPILFEQITPGNWIADFGKAAFGTLELTVSTTESNAGLQIFLGERMNKSLGVNKKPGHSNIGFKEISLELKKGTHTYQIEIPQHFSNSPHTQKLAPFYPEVLPFRYVEIHGNNAELSKPTQLALFYPFNDDAAHFYSSDHNLNKVWELCKYTLKATPFLGLYADGNRERMPYEADAFIQQLGHTSVDREYAVARYTADFLIYHSSWPSEWQMHSVLMAWEDYIQTGNRELLVARYDDLKAKTLIALAENNGLISARKDKLSDEFYESIHFSGGKFRDIVDWPKGTPEGKKQARNAGARPEGERDGYVFTDFNTVVNAFHYKALLLMSEIAAVSNMDDDIEFFTQQASKVKLSFQSSFFDAERGVYTDGIGTSHASLHANMFPLAFGLVADENIKSVLEHIKSRGMACSVYGAQYLLDALFNVGEVDYALSLMNSDSKRSWLNMIRVGSTMTTEAWDEYYKPNLTWNHAWGSAPANIIARRLMGVQALEPAFRKMSICPQLGSLQEAKLTMPTIRGTVGIDIKKDDNECNLEIVIPGNTAAELCLPSSFSDVIIDSEKIQASKKKHIAGKEHNIFVLQSGTHSIVAKQ